MCHHSPLDGSGATSTATDVLCDRHGRRVDYLRLSVTDRCDLRCRYCLPSPDPAFGPRSSLLNWEEMLLLSRILTGLGIRKIRLTGGEPLVRRGLLSFLAALSSLPQSPAVAMTTNGVRLAEYLGELKQLGIMRLNVSLDSMNPATYSAITQKDLLARVWQAVVEASQLGFQLKINVVVLPGLNDAELPAFVELTRHRDWTVRFIEPMPFTGRAGSLETIITGAEIHERLIRQFTLHPVPQAETAVGDLYQVPGYRGCVGIIQGHTRTFCGSCSRLRLSAHGLVRTCLYGPPVLDLRAMLRAGASEEQIAAAVHRVVQSRPRDGRSAAMARQGSARASMAVIGG